MFQQDQTTIKNQGLTWSRDLTCVRKHINTTGNGLCVPLRSPPRSHRRNAKRVGVGLDVSLNLGL